MSNVHWVRNCMILSTFAAGATAALAEDASLLGKNVREANGRFTDVATAVAEGYGPIPCASSATSGAMGIHYVNPVYLNDKLLDIAKPEAVMYEPQPDGSMQLIAVEYIAFEGPASLGGQLFSYNTAPNRYGLDAFYELHVWAWRANKSGSFADNNPDVTCDHARE